MSAQAVSGQVQALTSLKNTLTGTAGSSTTQVNLGASLANITTGTGAGQANEMWSETITFTASTPVVLDLTALTGEGGRTVDFAAIKYLKITNRDSVAGHDVKVGDSGTNDWTAPWTAIANIETVPGGGPSSANGTVVGNNMLKENWTAAGWTVDATHKELKLDPGANAVGPVDIVIAGNSA